MIQMNTYIAKINGGGKTKVLDDKNQVSAGSLNGRKNERKHPEMENSL